MNSPNEFSRINFLFVTLFYCLDNISQSELGIRNSTIFICLLGKKLFSFDKDTTITLINDKFICF